MVPTKVVCGYWIEKGVKGAIINMASMGSYVPLSGVWGYDAAKAGVLNLTMATAKEFADEGLLAKSLRQISERGRAGLIGSNETAEDIEGQRFASSRGTAKEHHFVQADVRRHHISKPLAE